MKYYTNASSRILALMAILMTLACGQDLFSASIDRTSVQVGDTITLSYQADPNILHRLETVSIGTSDYSIGSENVGTNEPVTGDFEFRPYKSGPHTIFGTFTYQESVCFNCNASITKYVSKRVEVVIDVDDNVTASAITYKDLGIQTCASFYDNTLIKDITSLDCSNHDITWTDDLNYFQYMTTLNLSDTSVGSTIFRQVELFLDSIQTVNLTNTNINCTLMLNKTTELAEKGITIIHGC